MIPMAMKRSHSEPRGNPFWSERAADEWLLQQLRPRALPETPSAMLPPVPPDQPNDWEEKSEEGSPEPVNDRQKGSPQVVLSEKKEGRGSASSSAFRTPRSWQLQERGWVPKTQGPMPREEMTRSEGPMEKCGVKEDRALEEALEAEMLDQLLRENAALRQKLTEVQTSKTGSSWSEITGEHEAVTPKRGVTIGLERKEENNKFTPGGTQVPTGPPPSDVVEEEMADWVPPPPPMVPSFPDFAAYEKLEIGGGGERMRFGDKPWKPLYPSGEGQTTSAQDLWMAVEELNARSEALRQICLMDGTGRKDQVLAPSHDLCHQDRARGSSTELGGHRQRFGICQGDRAFGNGMELGEHLQRFGICQGDRAFGNGTELGEHLQRSGVYQGDRAFSNSTEHGGQVRHFGVDYDSRAFEASAGEHGEECEQDRASKHRVSYREVPHRHQQLPCGGLCDPMSENVESLHKERRRDKSPNEGLRSTTPNLPKLPQSGQKYSSVDASDWLAEVRPLIGDLSTMSSVWWDLTLKHVMKSYNQWISATPLERLRQPPPEPVRDPSLNSLQTQRLEQRVTTMLLPCLDDELRKDVIATRSLWPAAIVFRILKVFQPGGHNERSLLLNDLALPKGCKDPGTALTALRLWKRQRSRAVELGATLPDVLLQVRALDAMCAPFLSKFPQTSFRISTYRMETHLDERPTDVTLMQFHELLTAEMENLSTNTEMDPVEKPSAKLLQQSGQTSSPLKKGTSGDKTCKFWGSPDGCKFGKQCKFVHGELEDKQARCWNCSSLGHRRGECPHGAQSSSKKLDGGSGGASSGGVSSNPNSGSSKSSGKGKSNGDGGTGKSGGKSNGGGKSSGKKDKEENETNQENPKIAATTAEPVAKPTDADGAQAKQASTGETELVSEVASLLKSLRIKTSQASVKVCQLRKIAGGDRCVLLDGGATHCLRTCQNDQEWFNSKEIKVTLADGETVLRQLPNGTLITKQQVQSIVPVSLVAALGYNITWDANGCEIVHPRHGALPVTLSQGCPIVPESVGMDLMEKVEKLQKETCQIRAILGGEDVGSSTLHERLQQLRKLFPKVPTRLLQHVVGSSTWEAELLPLNRRKRRQVEKAKTLVIYTFSGPEDKGWCKLESNGTVVLCLDLLMNHNLLDPHLSGWLEQVLRTKRVDLFLSSPPCRSTSLCRHRNDDGPKPLRGVHQEERFGLPELTAYQQQQADMDSILWLKSLYWIWLGRQTNPTMKCLVESPQDPNQWCEALDGEMPSFWKWPETLEMAQLLKLELVNLQQGALGHRTAKPTTLMSDLEEIKQLQGLHTDNGISGRLKFQPWEWSPRSTIVKKSDQWPTELEDRLNFSKSLAGWAPGLKNVIANAILRISKSEPPCCLRLSVEELQSMKAWEAHIQQGHCPFRRDCAVCVETRGRNRPHMRQENVDAFCLSLDISGPYENGIDQEILKPRYYLTGVITIPKSGDHPLVQGLRELGFSAKEAEEVIQNPLPSTSSSAQPTQTFLGGTADHGRGNEDPSLKACEAVQEGESAQEALLEQGIPGEPLVESPGEKGSEPLSESEVKEFDVLDQQWKELLKTRPTIEVANVSQSIPIKSRAPKDVLQGLAVMTARLRALRIPIARIHTDRAKEFVSQQFRSWVRSRELIQSSTAGDEPMSKGRCESELGVVRGQARAAMRAAGCATSMWPLAVRYASECRLGDQLRGLGVPCPQVLPFGLRAFAKRKTWHKVSSWESPNLPVRLWGPAHDMAMTSGGYFAELPDGKFMRTTAIIVPATTTSKGEIQTFVKPDLQPINPGMELQQVMPIGPMEEDTFTEPIETHIELNLFDEEVSAQPVVQPGGQDHQPRKPRRMHGKHTVLPDGKITPALRQLVLRAGGESDDDQEQGDWLRSLKQAMDEVDKLTLLQHQSLESVAQQLVSEINEGVGAEWNGPLVQRVRDEQRRLEGYLKSVQTCEKDVIEQEVLQTRTVAMQEVRNEYQEWIKPFQEEYDDLVKTVIQPLDPTELRSTLESSNQVERVPGKLVATIKPPSKKRGRIVACGNFISHPPGETSASGLDCIALRSVLRMSANEQWEIASTDVRRAFLNAPRLERGGRTTLVDPPMLLQKMGITKPGEVWKVTGALYGLCESPHDWSVHRDCVLQELKWEWNSHSYFLQESEERNLWRIKDVTQQSTVGYLCVYVDDLLATGPRSVVDGVISAIKKSWEVSEPEWVDENHWLRFCGFELQRLQGGGVALGQISYVQDLLDRHEVSGFESQPSGKVPEIEDEIYSSDTLKTAQGFVGELQWLQGRTRPDLCYTISLMSRLIHRNPRVVISMAHHVLRYLNRTKDLALWYTPCRKEDWGENNVLHLQRSMDRLEVYCDTSFGLEHEGGRSVQGTLVEWAGAPIQWSSSRQPFVAASTGEAELIGYSEGHQQGLSIGAILSTLEISPTYVLYGDCKSALSLATTESGPWRTRHLRLRAHKLRESLRTSATNPHQEPEWSARHLSGSDLVADGLTKPLVGASFLRYVKRLSLHGSWLNNQAEGSTFLKKVVSTSSGAQTLEGVQGLCGDALSGIGPQLLAAGTLLMRGCSSVLRGCGHILIAIGALMVEKSLDGNLNATRGEDSEEGNPRLCAFRAPGDPSRDQVPLRPPINRARRAQREQSRSLGTSHQDLYRHYDVPQPIGSRERLWWEDPKFDNWPVGADKWIQTREGLLIRTHNKLRRRAFHPLHRSIPIPVSELKSVRHTAIFPQDAQSVCGSEAKVH